MTTKHHITNAEKVFIGSGYVPQMEAANGRKGIEIMPTTKISLGAPAVGDADHLVYAATGTELPDTETVTYTTADDGTAPFDNADTPTIASITTSTGTTASVWPLDVPRNLISIMTHGSSVVASTIVITGYDYWKEKVVEQHSITATGTTKTVNGKKAFAYVESIAITAAADSELNTLNLGTGDVLGLPYKLTSLSDVICFYADGTEEGVASTVVAAVTTTATATTGDVRGTIDPDTTLDGSVEFNVWMFIAGRNTAAGLKGVDQYGG